MKPWAYLLALLCAAPLAQAADGMLDVHGELVMSACGLDPNSQRLEVGLGLVSSQMFKRIGDRSQPVPFNIRLTECSIDTLTTVAVRFSGAPDQENRALM
ncbi:fimbrial protein, partial [Pseudomonas sp. MWU13-2860]